MSGSASGGRVRWLYAVPGLALLAWTVLPLVLGWETLFLRDVFNTHLPLKQVQAEALRAGTLPLVDLFRAGGQPLLGNPNAVPLYPDNLLYLLGAGTAGTLWALNAHFWLHLLLAGPSMAWLARAWGLGRRASWATGLLYATGGFYLSHLSFYNLIAGATLAPAFVAAALTLARASGRRRWSWAAVVGGAWAMLLLGGDPLSAAQAGLLAVTAVCAACWRAPSSEPRANGLGWPGFVWPGVVALVLGSLVALPQIVEFLRILPGSFRGGFGYSSTTATVASWDPRQLVEQLLPFPFGRPDLIRAGSFWGHRFYTGTPPYFFALYPGILGLVLALAGLGRHRMRRASWWAWGLVGGGLFLVLGRFNPLGAWLFELPGLRYPVKLWLLVAVGLALAAGVGFQRVVVDAEPGPRRRAFLGLGVLGLLYALAWSWLSRLPAGASEVLRGLIPVDRPDAFVTNERLRLAGLCLISMLAVAALAGVLAWTRRRPLAGGALLLALHVALQLFLLRPLFPTDEVTPYLAKPALADQLAAAGPGAHGAFGRLFGSSTLYAGQYPDGRLLWLERRAFQEVYPLAAPLWGVRNLLNVSPEGLDALWSRVARAAVEQSEDEARVRLLRGWGAAWLLMDRPLEPVAEAVTAGRTDAVSFGQPFLIYRLPGGEREVRFHGDLIRVADVDGAFDRLTDPDHDPARTLVLATPGPAREGGRGTARLVRSAPEEMVVEVEADAPGAVWLRRSHLPLYRATVNDEAAPVALANFHQMAVEVPAGRSTVRVWISRRPLFLSCVASVLGLVGLLAAVWVGGRSGRSDD